jgi:aldose 1-epimerase
LNKLQLATLLLAATPFAFSQTKVTQAPFGTLPDGSKVSLFTLADKELTIKVISFGAHIISIQQPDRSGKVADVVLGYKDLAGYVADNKTYMGSVVGRYGNRIGKGRFTLDGHTYQLDTNNNGNTLHGGTLGFDRKNWTAHAIPSGVELTLISPNGDMGFPGTLTAHVKYTLAGDKLRVDYTATTDKPTVVNLTQHSYFNLAGSGSILDHRLMIDADRFTPVDKGLIPTGPLASVTNTPMDFRSPTAIGGRINDAFPQLKLAGGYDHNWVLNGAHTLTHPAAIVQDPTSGRTLTVFTEEPGIQFYAGVSLDGTFHGRDGQQYNKYSGLCLETQHFPDSPNRPDFPSTTLLPGKTYKTSTIFQFTAR